MRLADSGTFDHAWQIQSLSLPDGLAGAVAASGGDWELHRSDVGGLFSRLAGLPLGRIFSSVLGKIRSRAWLSSAQARRPRLRDDSALAPVEYP